MIKVISFDLDGTLFKKNFADAFWLEGVPSLYAQRNNLSLEAAKKFLFQEYEKIGDSRIEWYDPSYWFDRFHLHSDWKNLLEHYRSAVAPFPDAAPILNRLSKDYELIVSSNAKKEFITIQLEEAHMKNCFTHVFSSTSDFHTIKKVTEFYAMICKKLQITPDEMIHVGDHRDFDYIEPKKLGIPSFYLDRENKSSGGDVIHNLHEFEEKIRMINRNK